MDLGFRQRGFFTALSAIIMLLFIASCGGDGDGVTPSPSHPSWGTAELIGPDDLGNAESPRIAFDNVGNAIVVWRQYDVYNHEAPIPLSNIWANYFDGTAWGTAELIGTDDVGNASPPQFAFDTAGNATAVWSQDNSVHTNIWINHFDGTAWGTADLIATDDNTWYPLIALDIAGNVIAVWSQYDGTSYSIWANYFDGTAWGTAELIGTDGAGDTRIPQIAFDAAGNAMVVWQQYDGTRYNIWANYFNGAAWGTAEKIENDDTDTDWRVPQVAFDTVGKAIAVWSQHDGTRYNIWANYFDGTAWGTAELIGTNVAGDARAPQIAFDAAGNAIVVWQQYDGPRSNIWANYFDGEAWGTAEQIATDDSAWYPQIALDAAGNAIVAWNHSDGTRFNIRASYYDGEAWGTAERIATEATDDARDAKIAFDNAGKAIAVWSQYDGTRCNIWANCFE